MLTLFTIPKPFVGHNGLIQRNAIRSWAQSVPGCQIVLCGDETGIGAMAEEVGAVHGGDLPRNEFGTPLLDAAFQYVANAARYEQIAYLNADIILLDDFLAAAKCVAEGPYLLSARRWNVDLTEEVDFANSAWRARVRAQVAGSGRLEAPCAMDLFLFPRRSPLVSLPPFAVGRPAWDNWMVFRALSCRMAVVDATERVTLVHQNHDYRHVPVTQRNPAQGYGPEAERNRRLLGSRLRVFTLADATHRLTSAGLEKRRGWAYRLRRLARWPAFIPAACWAFERVAGPLAWLRRRVARPCRQPAQVLDARPESARGNHETHE